MQKVVFEFSARSFCLLKKVFIQHSVRRERYVQFTARKPRSKAYFVRQNDLLSASNIAIFTACRAVLTTDFQQI